MAVDLDRRLAHCIRALAIDAVEQAKSGHPGMPMGMADAALVLFARHLKYAAAAPDWPDRDRFILSNGHGSMLHYALLHLTGYAEMTMEQLKSFRQLDSITAGHPEFGVTPGIEVTTGPLGQGLAASVGMAIAERMLADEFGSELVDHRTWVIVGDGCMMEGVGQEAISLGGHLGLDKLIAVYDNNGITIDGETSLAFSEDVPARMRACNWEVFEADGHDLEQIDQAYAAATSSTSGKPKFISLRTIIGYGAPNKAGTAASHGSPLGSVEAKAAKQAIDWTHEPFVIPDDLLQAWRKFGARGSSAHESWQQRLTNAPARSEFERRIAHGLPEGLQAASDAKRNAIAAEQKKIATRKASQEALEFFAEHIPELVGGSADLSGSNLTKVGGMQHFAAEKLKGRYLYFGVREFAMCAAVNGIFLHGGFRAYGGTFLVFSDYARNAIRLASLMGIGSIFVMTHDSIGLGEDGPTHQPIEHLASLRAIPKLRVFRPADAVEAFECWELALACTDAPSLLALSRQGVPALRSSATSNLSAQGAYVLVPAEGKRAISILATGSEVHLAVEAAKQLAGDGIAAAVISMPCWELFENQSDSYRAEVLGDAPRIAIEAASSFGWTRYVASEQDVVGINDFGVSAPGDVVYRHSQISVERAVALAKEKVG